MQRFDQLELTPDTLNAIAAKGYETPTPVQAKAIPLFLKGRDVIAKARTGTGKTAAFGIPLIDEAARNPGRGVIGLVLTPTRELAQQVVDEINDLARASTLEAVAVYGGTGFGRQQQLLSRSTPMLVVATPGRLLDHIRRGTIRLEHVRTVVLDEADRMLDMGFLPDVERILGRLPRDRQTGLFSATVPEAIVQISRRFMRDPATVTIDSGPEQTPVSEQFRIDVAREHKTPALLNLLEREDPARAVVFTRTKHLARKLATRLSKAGWAAVALQGNMSQSQRDRAMDSFREGRSTILVATDVASRGLDVPEITHVINFDLPEVAEVYVHRVGRTARMGRSGRAFSFVQPDQRRDLPTIEHTAGATLSAYALDGVPAPPAQAPQQNGNGSNGGRRMQNGNRQGGQRNGRPGRGNRNRHRRRY
jgi:superfamily II DNA/RNA helicase